MFFGDSNGKQGGGGRTSNPNSAKDFGDEVEGYFLGRSSMNSKFLSFKFCYRQQ
jgi:hypothetical protein